MRLAAALMVALAATACASWDKSETMVTEIGRVPVDAAIGLSRAELETRLGLAPVAAPYVSSAWLDNGALMQRFDMFGMSLQRRCPSGRLPDLGFTRGGQTWGMPSLIYRDDVLTAFGDEPRRGDDDQTLPAFLTSTCTSYLRAGKDTVEDAFAIAIAAPVLLPVAALLGGINTVGALDDPDINVGLAQVPLGAAPPGGIDTWLANLPRGARLASRDGDTVHVAFCGNLCEDRYLYRAVTVTLIDGKVARLEGGKCSLTAARAFRCEKS